MANKLLTTITTLLLTSMLVLTCAAASASSPTPPPPPPSNSSTPPPPPGCSVEVVAFSPCLPYIADPPNNLTNSPSSQCCHVFVSAFGTGDANCLCYLVRQPLIFGFPLNNTKLFSLSSLCPVAGMETEANGFLESLCSGSQTLPPLQSTTGSGLLTPNSSGSGNALPPSISLPLPNSDDDPLPGESILPANKSSAAEQFYKNHNWFQPHTVIMVLIVPILCCL